jgi:hypothetical protein
VDKLGWSKIHYIRDGAATGTFAALEAQINIYATCHPYGITELQAFLIYLESFICHAGKAFLLLVRQPYFMYSKYVFRKYSPFDVSNRARFIS